MRGERGVVLPSEPCVELAECMRVASSSAINFDIAWTGLDCVKGREPRKDDSRLEIIMSLVITSRLNGTTPVFRKAALMFSGVRAFICASA